MGHEDAEKHLEGVKKANIENASYMGPTMLSELVRHWAQKVHNMFGDLLVNEAIDDPGRWAGIWKHVESQVHTEEARELIVHMVTAGASAWHKRFILEATSTPQVLLRLVEKPCVVACDVRRAVATLVLHGCMQCFRLEHGDITLKTRQFFYEDFVWMLASGKCTIQLYVHILQIRCVLIGETQYIEGFHNQVQTFAARAPSIRLPTVNAKMKIRHGVPLTAEQYASYNLQCLQHMNTEDWSERFAIVIEPRGAPAADEDTASGGPESERTSCLLHSQATSVRIAGRLTRKTMASVVPLGARYAYAVVPCSRNDGEQAVFNNKVGSKWFLAAWSYYSAVFGAQASSSIPIGRSTPSSSHDGALVATADPGKPGDCSLVSCPLLICTLVEFIHNMLLVCFGDAFAAGPSPNIKLHCLFSF